MCQPKLKSISNYIIREDEKPVTEAVPSKPHKAAKPEERLLKIPSNFGKKMDSQ
ncbi:hypothetical protein Tco_0384679, partial [Tanacetum coccineum]